MNGRHRLWWLSGFLPGLGQMAQGRPFVGIFWILALGVAGLLGGLAASGLVGLLCVAEGAWYAHEKGRNYVRPLTEVEQAMTAGVPPIEQIRRERAARREARRASRLSEVDHGAPIRLRRG